MNSLTNNTLLKASRLKAPLYRSLMSVFLLLPFSGVQAAIDLVNVPSSYTSVASDYTAVPPLVDVSSASDKPNVLMVLDNSNSMDEAAGDDEENIPSGAAVGSDSVDSKSEGARNALKTIINNFGDATRLGLMAYKQSGISLRHIHNSPYDVSFDPDNEYKEEIHGDKADIPRDSHIKKYRIPNPTNPGAYIYYNVGLPFYAGANYGNAFCRSSTADFDNGSETVSGPWDYYQCYRNKTTASDDYSSGFSSYWFGSSFHPTDSDYAQGILDFGRFMSWHYVGRTWFSNSSPGKGMLHVDIDDVDSSHKTLLLNKLATSQFTSATDTPLRNAGLTPIEGTLQSAKSYFQGTLPSSEIASSASGALPAGNVCGNDNDYVVLVTDGLPSVDASGNQITDTAVAVAAAAAAAADLLSSQNVKTFVVGFSLPEGVDASVLDQIAIAGGTNVAYQANSTASLNQALGSIFLSIINRTSSSTGVAVLANNTRGEGAVYQASYNPRMEDADGRSVNWVGGLQGLFIDQLGYLREDSNGNKALDGYDADNVVQYYYDSVESRTRIKVFTGSSAAVAPDTSSTPSAIKEVSELSVLWQARDQLAAVSDTTSQRDYTASASTGRHIVTSITGTDATDFVSISTAEHAAAEAAALAALNLANADLTFATISQSGAEQTVTDTADALADAELEETFRSDIYTAINAFYELEQAELTGDIGLIALAQTAVDDAKANQALISNVVIAEQAKKAEIDEYDAAVLAYEASVADRIAKEALEAAAKEDYDDAVADQGAAQTAYDNAVTAAGTALTARDNAVSAAATAQTNYDTADTAFTAAQTAYDNAVTAAGTALTARDNAVSAAAAAQTNYDAALAAAAGDITNPAVVSAQTALDAANGLVITTNTDLTNANQAVTDRQAELTTATTNRSNASDTLDAANDFVTTTNTDLTNANQDVTDRQGELTTATTNRSNASDTLAAANLLVTNTNTDLTNANQDVTDRQGELTTATTNRSNASDTRDAANDLVTTTNTDLTNANQAVIDRQAELTTAITEKSNASDDYDATVLVREAAETAEQDALDARDAAFLDIAPATADAVAADAAQETYYGRGCLCLSTDEIELDLSAEVSEASTNLTTATEALAEAQANATVAVSNLANANATLVASTAAQAAAQSAYDAAVLAVLNHNVLLNYLGESSGAEANKLVNYIRGEEQSGYRSRTIDFDGDSVPEVWRLGDIVHSTPALVGAPGDRYDSLYNDTTYATYREQYKNRRQVVYVGANDGMLHAFNAGFWNESAKKFELDDSFANSSSTLTNHPLGSELWAYVPRSALPHLKWLKDAGYAHTYYVDGEPVVFDANIFTPDDEHPNGWGTVLAVGLRFGGGTINVDSDGDSVNDLQTHSSYVLMDVTNPEAAPRLIAEISHSELGLATSKPAVVKDRTPKTGISYTTTDDNSWHLVFGSGPTTFTNATSTQEARLFVYDLVAKSFVTGFEPLNLAVSNSFVGDISVANWDDDFVDDTAYFGVIGGTPAAPSGKIMRYRLDQGSGTAVAAFVDTGRASVGKPLTVVDGNGRKWVYFGTGRLFDGEDNLSTPLQRYYGVMEPIDSIGATTWTFLSTSSLQDVSDINIFDNGDLTVPSGSLEIPTGTSITTFSALKSAIPKYKGGWFRDLYQQSPKPSGRNISASAKSRSIVFFTEYKPADNACQPEGTSLLYGVDYQTGTAVPFTVFGTDSSTTHGDGKLSEITVDLGQGMASAPTIIENNSGDRSSSSGPTVTILTKISTDVLRDDDAEVGVFVTGRESWVEIYLE